MSSDPQYSAVPHPVTRGVRHGREDEHSLGELFKELSHESMTLVQQEIALAKAELAEKASRVGRDAGMIGAGAIVAYLGAFFVLAAVTIGLGHLIGYGWAALVVGAVLLIAGGILAMKAKSDLANASLAPERTASNLKETSRWIRQQAH
jgi:hypothetical protein